LETANARLSNLGERAQRLIGQFSESRGSVQKALTQAGALRAQASASLARVDSIRSLLASDAHSLGRFRRDSTLATEIGRVRNELAVVQQLAASPNGTIGRFRADSAIMRNIQRSLASMDSLIADMKKHPLRYIAF
jgi:hypothetical protein